MSIFQILFNLLTSFLVLTLNNIKSSNDYSASDLDKAEGHVKCHMKYTKGDIS